MKSSNNSLGSFKELPSGYFGGYFEGMSTPYLLGERWANCFRTLHVFSMDPLGNWPLTPSVIPLEGFTPTWQRCIINARIDVCCIGIYLLAWGGGTEGSTVISCLFRQYSGLYLSPTLPTLLPASDISDKCNIRRLPHKYHNPPTDYFHIFPTIRSIPQPWSPSTTPPSTI